MTYNAPRPTPGHIDHEIHYLGIYCHGDTITAEHAIEAMTNVNSYLWSIVPSRDGSLLTVMRKDTLRPEDMWHAEMWLTRHRMQIEIKRDHRGQF